MSSLQSFVLLLLLLDIRFAFQVVAFLLLNMFLHISWCLHSVVSSETVSEASLSSLVGKRDALLKELEHFLHNSFSLHSDVRSKTQLAYRVSTPFPMISAQIPPPPHFSKRF